MPGLARAGGNVAVVVRRRCCGRSGGCHGEGGCRGGGGCRACFVDGGGGGHGGGALRGGRSDGRGCFGGCRGGSWVVHRRRLGGRRFLLRWRSCG